MRYEWIDLPRVLEASKHFIIYKREEKRENGYASELKYFVCVCVLDDRGSTLSVSEAKDAITKSHASEEHVKFCKVDTPVGRIVSIVVDKCSFFIQ